MALTPSYTTSTEATEVEQTYIDKGAVKMPQINPMVDAKYAKAKAEAEMTDFVEWPTDVHGQETQGF
jgi:hypothetical protein